MTRKEKRLKRKKKAEKKKLKKVWYKGDAFQLLDYYVKEMDNLMPNIDKPIVYTHNKFLKWEIETIEINDETIEQKKKSDSQVLWNVKK